MSSIKFSADLNLSKFKSSLSDAKKTLKEWVSGVEKGGNDIDRGFQKMGISAKDAVKNQRDLIKQIENEIKVLKTTFDEASPGISKGKAFQELKSAQRALKEEQGALISIQKQLNNSNIESGNSTGVLTNGITALAGRIFTAIALWKGFKAIMESTETTTSWFHSTINSAKTGLDYFMKSITTAGNGGFDNFIQGMRNAITAGKDYTKKKEEIENITNEFSLKRLDLDHEIEEQRRVIYEDDKTSLATKIAAGDKLLEKIKEKAALEKEIAIDTFKNESDLAKNKNKLSEEDIRFAIENYKELKKTGEQYSYLNGIVKEYEKNKKREFTTSEGLVKVEVDRKNKKVGLSSDSRTYLYSESDITNVKKAIDELGSDGEKMGNIWDGLGKLTNSERKVITDAIAAMKEADNQVMQESKRVFKMKENMQDQQVQQEKEAAQEILKLNNETNEFLIKGKELAVNEATKQMKEELRVVENNYKEETEKFKDKEEIKKALTEKYEAEKFLIIKKYYTELANIASKLDPGKGYSILNRTLESLGIKPSTGEELGANGTFNKLKHTKITLPSELQKDKQTYKDQEKADKERLENEKKLLNTSILFTDQLLEQLDLTKEEKDALGFMTGTIKELASGNWISAALGILAKVIGVFGQMGDVDTAERFKKQLSQWDALIARQEKLIELSSRIGGGEQALRNEIATYEKELAALKARLKTLTDRRGENDKFKDTELINKINETQDALDAAKQSLNEFLTGTTTQNNIADAIEQGLENGKSSAADFASTFNDFMRTAINSALEEMTKPQVAKWYQQFSADMASGGGLTSEEKDQLKAQWDKIIAEGEANRQAAYEAAGLSQTGTSTTSGLTGEIQRSITEDTGSELAGLFRRFADDERVIKDYSILGVNNLMLIEKNTAETVNQLQLAVIELKSIVSNTKPNYASTL
jgi:hypothetical protein